MEEESKREATGETVFRAGEAPKKKKKNGGKTALKIVIWVLVIALVVFLTLFLSAKIAQFDDIGDLINYIKEQI